MYSKFSKVIASVLVAATLISTVMSDMVYASNIDDNSQIEYQLDSEDETVVDIDAEPEEELNENETDVETVNSSTAVENIEEEDIVEDAVETAVYTINFYAGDEIIVSEEYEENSVIEFPDMSNDETFLGWQIKVDDDNLEDVNTESEEYIVTSDVDFYAVFEEKEKTELVETELKVEIDGYTVTATGNMPEGAELSVIPVDEEETMEYDEKINETLSDNVVYKSYVAFDIDILVDGEKWQPVDFDELVKISIQSAQIEEKKEEVASGIISDFDEENEEVLSYANVDDLEDTVYRIDAETEKIVEMVIDEEKTDVDAVEFETEHFTIYSYGGTSYNTTSATKTISIGTGYTAYLFSDGLFYIVGSGTWKNSFYTSSGISDSTLKTSIKKVVFACSEPTNTNIDYRIDNMFSGCTNLEKIEFTGTFTGKNAYYTYGMFSGCTNLTELILPDGFGNNSSNQFRLVENLKGLKKLYLPASIYTKYTSPNITGNSTTLFSSASQVRVTSKTGSSTVMTPVQAKTKMNTAQTVGYTYEAVAGPLFTFNSKSYYESDATTVYEAGTNIKAYWYASDGVLGFVGSGAMNNWVMNGGIATTPWWDNRENITKVYIDPKITSLGNYLLADTNVTNIYGLNTNSLITSIPKAMCMDCSNLTEVAFNNNIENIGSSAIAYCTSLTTFNFPSKLKTIESSAFRGNTALVMKDVSLPSNLESVGISAFNGCSKLALSGSLPTSLKTVNNYAFYGTKVTFTGDIPASMETIGSYAFPTTANFSTNKSGIAITYAMRVPTSYTVIDTFSDGKKANVTTIKTGYVGETSASGTAPTYSGYTLKTDCTNTAITIGSTASNRLTLTRVYEPARVKIFTYNSKDYYNTDATATYKAGDNVTAYWYESDGVLGFVGSGLATSYGTDQPWIDIRDNVTDLYMDDNITSIASSMFNSHTALERVKLPAGLTEMSSQIFYNCGKVQFPATLSEFLAVYPSITSISYRAMPSAKFTGDIPADITSLGNQPFGYSLNNCNFDRNLSNVNITSNMYIPTSYFIVDTFTDGKENVITTKKGYVGNTSFAGTAPTYEGYKLKTDCVDATITIGKEYSDRLTLTRVYEPDRNLVFTYKGKDYYDADATKIYDSKNNPQYKAYWYASDGVLGFVNTSTTINISLEKIMENTELQHNVTDVYMDVTPTSEIGDSVFYVYTPKRIEYAEGTTSISMNEFNKKYTNANGSSSTLFNMDQTKTIEELVLPSTLKSMGRSTPKALHTGYVPKKIVCNGFTLDENVNVINRNFISDTSKYYVRTDTGERVDTFIAGVTYNCTLMRHEDFEESLGEPVSTTYELLYVHNNDATWLPETAPTINGQLIENYRYCGALMFNGSFSDFPQYYTGCGSSAVFDYVYLNKVCTYENDFVYTTQKQLKSWCNTYYDSDIGMSLAYPDTETYQLKGARRNEYNGGWGVNRSEYLDISKDMSYYTVVYDDGDTHIEKDIPLVHNVMEDWSSITFTNDPSSARAVFSTTDTNIKKYKTTYGYSPNTIETLSGSTNRVLFKNENDSNKYSAVFPNGYEFNPENLIGGVCISKSDDSGRSSSGNDIMPYGTVEVLTDEFKAGKVLTSEDNGKEIQIKYHFDTVDSSCSNDYIDTYTIYVAEKKITSKVVKSLDYEVVRKPMKVVNDATITVAGQTYADPNAGKVITALSPDNTSLIIKATADVVYEDGTTAENVEIIIPAYLDVDPDNDYAFYNDYWLPADDSLYTFNSGINSSNREWRDAVVNFDKWQDLSVYTVTYGGLTLDIPIEYAYVSAQEIIHSEPVLLFKTNAYDFADYKSVSSLDLSGYNPWDIIPDSEYMKDYSDFTGNGTISRISTEDKELNLSFITAASYELTPYLRTSYGFTEGRTLSASDFEGGIFVCSKYIEDETASYTSRNVIINLHEPVEMVMKTLSLADNNTYITATFDVNGGEKTAYMPVSVAKAEDIPAKEVLSTFSVKLPASINVTGSNETMKHFGDFTVQAKGNKSKIMVTLPNAITLTGKNTTETFDLNVSKQNYIFKPILSAEDVNTDDTEYAELSSESYSSKSGKVSSNEDPTPDVYEGGLTVTITSED